MAVYGDERFEIEGRERRHDDLSRVGLAAVVSCLSILVSVALTMVSVHFSPRLVRPDAARAAPDGASSDFFAAGQALNGDLPRAMAVALGAAEAGLRGDAEIRDLKAAVARTFAGEIDRALVARIGPGLEGFIDPDTKAATRAQRDRYADAFRALREGVLSPDR